MIDWANAIEAPILALDVPSGVDSTSGESPGSYVHPTSTMTLALPKTGLRPEKTGALCLADIGIPARAFKKLGLDYVPPFDPGFRVPLRAAG